MSRLAAKLIAAVIALILGLAPAGAEGLKGVALVVGQSKYEHLPPLANPAADAQAIAKLLADLGFSVTVTSDRNARKLRRDVENFASDAEGSDVAVVYYSGHGIEADGANWLVPVDADGASLDDAGKNLVALSDLMADLREEVPLALVFLDACRTNPFPPGASLKHDGKPSTIGGAGLAAGKGVTPAGEMAAGSDLVIGFAAEPGQAALDGPPDGNSPYALALTRHLAASAGLEFGQVMRLVTEEVYLTTKGQQRPWVNESLTRLLYFGGKPDVIEGDDGRLNQGRRALLLSIAGLDADMRQRVEQLAKDNGLPLDPLYGMLKQLQVDTSAGAEQLDKQLRAGVEAVKKLKAERDTITRTDPAIVRMTGLADRAEAEGAIPLAAEYRAKASARALEISKALKAEEQNLKARHLEVAATFAKEAETAILAFDHTKAAEKFAMAFAEVEAQDARLAARYKWNEAQALQNHGDFKGDNAALDAAIAAYQVAIGLTPREEHPMDWAALAGDLGNALAILGERDAGTARLEDAVQAYRAALDVRRREAVPLDWAATQSNLGNALLALGQRDAGAERLVESVAAFRAALEEMTRVKAPFEWAMTQANLGTALQAIGEREAGTARLEEAIQAYRAALGELNPETASFQWARLETNLGASLQVVAERTDDTAALAQAVQSYRAALGVLKRDTAPLAWATAQLNLGVALQAIGKQKGDSGTLEEAVSAFRLALEEHRRDRLPMLWAMTQKNLANALLDLGRLENRADRFDEAVTAYRLALQEWTRKTAPVQWATAQNNLGYALQAMGEGEAGTVHLKQAIAAYRAALLERSREAAPVGWAKTQNNLGWCLALLGSRLHKPALVLEGRQAVQAASEIFVAAGMADAAYFADRLAMIDAMGAALEKP